MSGVNDGTRDLRTRFDKPADEKECCVDLMMGKYVEEPFGMDVVWAVVVSESQIARIRTVRKRRAEELRARRIGVIRKVPGCC